MNLIANQTKIGKMKVGFLQQTNEVIARKTSNRNVFNTK